METELDDAAPQSALLQLPAELLVAILARCDFPSLSALVRSHSQLCAVWAVHTERIARAICIRHHLADPQSCGAAQPLENPVGTELPHPGTRLDAQELRNVVKSQLWMNAGRDISSWLAYARVRHVIQRNWVAGRARVRHLSLDFSHLQSFQQMLIDQNHIWRFKLDAEPGYIVATGRLFGVHAFRAADGVRVWGNPHPFLPYAHIELSAGHFATASGDMQHAIWRRDDLDPDFDPGSAVTGGVEYTFMHHLATNVPCSATKMRWPYFVAVSHGSDEVYRFDLSRSPPQLVTHRLTPFWTAVDAGGLGERNVHYVEIDARAIYLAGEKSVLLWRYDEPGDQHVVWPPDPPSARSSDVLAAEDIDAVPIAFMPAPTATGVDQVPRKTHYRGSHLDGFAAVHHDGCGRHLVGVAGEVGAQMRLYWTTDYLTTIWCGDRALLERKTVVLTTPDLPCAITIDQLAVENGRAVFIVHDEELGNSLWLINLRDFADLDDFVAAPPRPICLAWPLPCGTSISRVEMTSDEIYVPAVSEMLAAEIQTRLGEVSATLAGRLMYDWQWHALDGTVLVDYVARGDTVDLASERGANARELAVRLYTRLLEHELEGAWQHSGTDAFAVFSFHDDSSALEC
ncbi:hypothetical protein JCM3774_000473 [Rhodotorula dairenensis]